MITLTQIYDARSRISGYVRRTPLIEAKPVKTPVAPIGDIYLKLECLQVTGSFKARGAVNKLMTLALTGNQIVDVGPLASQTELSLLMLEKNKVASLAPLMKWLKADADGAKRFAPYLRLYLAGNPLDDESKAKHLPAMKAIGVRLEDVEKK